MANKSLDIKNKNNSQNNQSVQSKISDSLSKISGLNKNSVSSNVGNNIDNKSLLNSNSLLNNDTKVNIITENYLLILSFVIAFIIFVLIYFFSKSFRVSRTLDTFKIYQKYQNISSFDYIKRGNVELCKCRIASAYNACHNGYQIFDYTSEDITLGLIQSGVRYLEFNIFNSEFGKKANPVISMGYKKGEWKLTLTDTRLEYCLNIIANNAFKTNDGDSGCPNPDDPIFIGLNLNNNNNLDCLNIVADLLTDYFGERFIDNKYSFQSSDDIPFIKMKFLLGKVVIFASDGFQGSRLEELVNYSWDNITNNKNHKMQRIHHTYFDDPKFNSDELIEFNKTGLTIVIPNKEGDFWSSNYDCMKALDYGCQFVTMNYQYIDDNIDKYITTFKNKSILVKPKELQ